MFDLFSLSLGVSLMPIKNVHFHMFGWSSYYIYPGCGLSFKLSLSALHAWFGLV